MQVNAVKRLLFMNALRFRQARRMQPLRCSPVSAVVAMIRDLIEALALDYTIVHATLLPSDDELAYEIIPGFRS